MFVFPDGYSVTRKVRVMKTLHVKTSYMGDAQGDPEELALNFLEFTQEVQVDTIVGVGLSGALVVPLMGHILGLNWALARKFGDGSHSSTLLEGKIGKHWVFVDDLISSGNSMRKTQARVELACARNMWETSYVGSYFYTYAPLGEEVHPFRVKGEELAIHTGEYYIY